MVHTSAAAIWPLATVAAFPATGPEMSFGSDSNGGSSLQLASIGIIPWVFVCQVRKTVLNPSSWKCAFRFVSSLFILLPLAIRLKRWLAACCTETDACVQRASDHLLETVRAVHRWVAGLTPLALPKP